jgi:HEPN domain-containing protein
MPDQPRVREALVRQWLESARDDLAWAEMGAASPRLPGHAQIGFHAQQAAEKLLKGLLTAYGVEPEEHHNLGRLVEQVRRLDRATADSVAAVSSLTMYAVYYRYPPRVPREGRDLKREDVLRDLGTVRSAFPILENAIETRLRSLGRKAGDGGN